MTTGRARKRLSAKARTQILDGACAYCGYPWPTEIDHVTPFSRGGLDDVSNLVPACRPCNANKLDFTPDEWRAWRESEGLSWPPENMLAWGKAEYDRLRKEDARPMSTSAERKHTTLADLYRDRGLSDSQVRRVVALLRLTDRSLKESAR